MTQEEADKVANALSGVASEDPFSADIACAYLSESGLGFVFLLYGETVTATLEGVKPVHLFNDKRAVTALEYGIIAGVLGLVLILSFQHFGTTLSKLFSTISSSL